MPTSTRSTTVTNKRVSAEGPIVDRQRILETLERHGVELVLVGGFGLVEFWSWSPRMSSIALTVATQSGKTHVRTTFGTGIRSNANPTT